MNVDQIYSCLLKLKVNFLTIGPNSDYKKKNTLSMVTKLKLSLYIREPSFIYLKKNNSCPSPTKKTK